MVILQRGIKMSEYAHLKLYPDDFHHEDVWNEICKACEADPTHEMLVITFKYKDVYTEEKL
jgi:hypothetical protein